jgi:hypothetical protein
MDERGDTVKARPSGAKGAIPHRHDAYEERDL